jgi:hypothetical protein
MKITTAVARLAIGLCGLVVGTYCALSAFRNGQSLAPGIDGDMFGAAFAAVVIGSWFILPLSRNPLARAGWLLCTGFVLANAIGYTASHRTTTVGEKQNTIAAYTTAQQGLEQATERLTAMKGNRRWESTKGCTDVTAEQSITFCNDFSETQAKADKLQAIVLAGRPATPDAQADTIGWVIQADTATVSKALPIFMAVVLDIAATLFMYLALVSKATPAISAVVSPVATPKTKSAKAKNPTARKDRVVQKRKQKQTANAVAKLKTIATNPASFKPPFRVRKNGNPDRRFKGAKAANDFVKA